MKIRHVIEKSKSGRIHVHTLVVVAAVALVVTHTFGQAVKEAKKRQKYERVKSWRKRVRKLNAMLKGAK